MTSAAITVATGFARLKCRARIETLLMAQAHPGGCVSPGLNAGRGLKLGALLFSHDLGGVSPGLNAGRGLKQLFSALGIEALRVSPGLNAGRGLKLEPAQVLRGFKGFRPA